MGISKHVGAGSDRYRRSWFAPLQLLGKNAVAGTLESSDAMVTVEPNAEGAGIEFDLDSVVINQFGNSIRRTVMDTLKRLDVQDVKISIVDKGALDCTLKARVEGALFRGAEQTEDLPWGGAIR